MSDTSRGWNAICDGVGFRSGGGRIAAQPLSLSRRRRWSAVGCRSDGRPCRVLRPGDWVICDGGEHQAVASAATSPRLWSRDGTEQGGAGHASDGLSGVRGGCGAPLAAVEPFGLLEGLTASALEAAREWELPLGGGGDRFWPLDALRGAGPRPGFDPGCRTVVERAAAKAGEPAS
jgi:hypothetical protein